MYINESAYTKNVITYHFNLLSYSECIVEESLRIETSIIIWEWTCNLKVKILNVLKFSMIWKRYAALYSNLYLRT